MHLPRILDAMVRGIGSDTSLSMRTRESPESYYRFFRQKEACHRHENTHTLLYHQLRFAMESSNFNGSISHLTESTVRFLSPDIPAVTTSS
jgi:hypothetical protein